jgi:hypothetical protein
MSVRKFIQKYHRDRSNGAAGDGAAIMVPPDVLIEVDEILFGIEDDWMEIKLRANYEVMCDEYNQKKLRHESLNEKIKLIKGDQGILSQMSAKKEQHLYESLEISNISVYCQRIKDMYSDPKLLKNNLFTVSLSQTHLLILSDPTMLGGEALVGHLKDINHVSPLPNDYSFSTLWGCYISLTSEHMEVTIRDYPWKLLGGESMGVAGRLVFAEQEAQERECYDVVVPVGEPWVKGVVTRKLPPLKYYHDLTITADSLEVSWGPPFDPSFAQLNYCFNHITKPSADPSHPIPWWDKVSSSRHMIRHMTRCHSYDCSSTGEPPSPPPS